MISGLAPVGDGMRELLLRRFAGRAHDDGQFQSIPAMIEATVDRYPQRPAVTYRDVSLSYRHFDELANGLADSLAQEGVGPGDIVAVLLGNGLELPIVYYALMKLGAIFVPLDPLWPADRIRSTLEVLGSPLVIGGGSFPVDVAHLPHVAERPGHVLTGDDLIYGIFTSGTTGTPKCALNRHAGLTNRFRFMTRYFHATGAEVVLQNSRHTYDSSVWQLFWPLTTGGRTVIPAQGDFLDLEHTIGLIERHAVTMTDFVPSVFNALVSMADSNRGLLSRMGSLRELVVGGEEINPRMAHRLTELLPQVRITNGYGPTEASIGMVFHPVSAADGDTIPLGRPIDNCYAVIVDEQMDLTPPGEAGELVIGGACLGSGYLGDPVRTGEVFVPNPFPEVPGARLYRTGDVARFDKLGRLHFLGRRDSQVKIGGVRLELGEIEAAANRCRGVWHSKVLPVDRGSGRSLALFVAGEPGLTRTGVREQLTNLLPRHHLPRHVVVVEAMPLNGNGKVDRAALLAVLEQRLAGGTPAESSAGLLDRVLWVFRNTLGQPDLEPDDNFHHAGGDSIQSVTAAAALTHEAALTIGVQDLFDCPTASAMASLIEHRQLTSAEDLPDELWRHDLALAEPVAVRAPEPTRAMRRVLVTGATGFVGSRLVHELLTSTELAVECVVRGEHDEDARSRVIGALEEQGLWDKRFDDRLTAYAGDLSRPRLGLAAASWDHLAATCDLVLHNGALVNLVFDYHAHRGPNVLGTCEVLRLAMSHHAKPLHHVSTLGVLDEEAGRRVDNGGEPLSEALDLATSPPPPSGYSRSKWLAEQLLSGASRRGASITVYRLGEIVPSGDNGRPNPRALTHLLLSAFLRLGVSPQVPMRSDYTPVDYAARRVVAGIQDPAVWGQVLHVFHPESVCYADALARVAQPVDRVSCRAFLARLAEAAHDTGDRELNTLLALLNPPPVADEATLRRLFTRLLADNPRLFRKDQCRQLEQRWGLTDEWLYQPIAAYRDHLSLI